MAGVGRSPWRVLVVDDEENLNWSLVNSLRKEGYEADGVLTGEDALRRLAEVPCNCVISDVKMPGMDGFELLEWLRRYQPHTRVIMMTAFGSPTARTEALRNGVIAYLEKPFDLHTLKEQLRRVVASETSGQTDSEAYDLLEIARVLNLARRDIALRVQNGGYTGMLRFLHGDLIWAEAGSLTGDEAFLALCVPRGGHVQPEAWDGRMSRNVTQPVSRLIYAALAYREGRRVTPPPANGQSEPDASVQPQVPATSQPTPVPATPTSPPRPQVATTDITNGETILLPAINPSSPTSQAPQPTVAVVVEDTRSDALLALASALPAPCGIVLLRSDTTVAAQHWINMPEMPASVYTHLMSAFQAAARASLLADFGSVEDVCFKVSDRSLLMRRAARADRAGLLVAVLPRDADLAAAADALQTYGPAVLELLAADR